MRIDNAKLNLIALSISPFLLIACGVPQSELDAAKKQIAELEAKLKLQQAIVSQEQVPSKSESPSVKTIPLEVVPQTPVQVTQWQYTQDEDKMAGGKTFFATVTSSNSVDFGFPYNGEQYSTLSIRNDPKYGKDVIFRIQKGQILCSSYDGCNVLIRFDDEKAVKYSANPPADNSTEVIFIGNYSRFVEKLRKAKQVRISPTVYQEGAPVFEFDITGFELDKFKPKN